MAFVDMHIHSIYSDGTYAPEEIVRRALEDGAGLISVCDHNVFEGTLKTEPLALQAGLKYIRGAEVDALWRGINVHILCYDADFENPTLSKALQHARVSLDNMSIVLLGRMQADYPALDMDEFMNLSHDTALGGWKMLQYLQMKGVTRKLKDGFPFYKTYGVDYETAGFQPAAQVVEAIHQAGGWAVLAHPGVTLSYRDMDDFRAQVEDVLDEGLDGVECHYPTHSRALARACLDICRARDLKITAGSDCHGRFGRHIIAETRTEMDQVRLGRALI